MQEILVIDSHTEGEPTRVVYAGGPDAGSTTPLDERVKSLKDRFDHYRRAVVLEPRGSDVLVGAYLVPPCDSTCSAGVIFFNNVGYLGMCGHGTIGLVATLEHLNRLEPGALRIETPVGIVTAQLHGSGKVSVQNVPSFRKAKSVRVEVPGIGPVVGDVAWGGNYFFLVDNYPNKIDVEHVGELQNYAERVRHSVNTQGYPEVDHVELFGPPQAPQNDSRNFVLCPGGAYDRSPCGTGTSAKLACLIADGKLQPGQVWRQESVLGSVFEAVATVVGSQVIPTVTGRAWIVGQSRLLLDESDPFCWGIAPRSSSPAQSTH